MNTEKYHYAFVDKMLIAALYIWGVFTLFGHTIIHAIQSSHGHTNEIEHHHDLGEPHSH